MRFLGGLGLLTLFILFAFPELLSDTGEIPVWYVIGFFAIVIAWTAYDRGVRKGMRLNRQEHARQDSDAEEA